jgi:hypothetical protein
MGQVLAAASASAGTFAAASVVGGLLRHTGCRRAAAGTIVPSCLVARHGTLEALYGRASADAAARRHCQARHGGPPGRVGPGRVVLVLVPGRAARLASYRARLVDVPLPAE